MKVLMVGSKKRMETYSPHFEFMEEITIQVLERDAARQDILDAGKDVKVLIIDAIYPVDKEMIDAMPNLKMIHSEGVGFNGIDCEYAAEKGIYVCNNKGVNAGAVAEQTILLMLALLRDFRAGDRGVREGQQMTIKENKMLTGIRELSECTVGIVGFGDIGKAVAQRLAAFDARVIFYNRSEINKKTQESYQAEQMSLEQVLKQSDFVSLHLAVTQDTAEIANKDFFDKMKPGAYLINTARGELVDQEAFCKALEEGKIGGGGFDTLYPEPVSKENPILNVREEWKDLVLLSPHIGGITTGTFYRAHKHIWKNVEKIYRNELPDCIVNGI